MSVYSLANFLQHSAQDADLPEAFQLESPHLLKIDLKGAAWTKMGTMIAYRGNIAFKREGMMEHGLGKLFKKALTGEGMTLTKAEGNGELFLADAGKKVSVIYLENEAICVNGNDLLAFDPSIQWDIKMIKRVAGMMAGGLFNIRLEGKGYMAITTHYEPLTLRVTPNQPVFTDPNATVAWSANLQPELRTDISWGTLLGRGSGESFQLGFWGDGFVVVQPYEEVYFQTQH